MKYTISRNPEQTKLLAQYNLRYAAMATCIDGTHELIIGEEFDNAPKYVQDFIIHHEEGHILNGQDEYDADSNAVKEMGKAKAIKALWWMYMDATNFAAGLELLDRITYIVIGEKHLIATVRRTI